MNLPPELNQMGSGNQMIDQQNPEMEQSIPDPENILAHMTPHECDFLDGLQGEKVIDPETGLRDYTALEFAFKLDPSLVEEIDEVANMVKSEKRMAEGGLAKSEGRPIAPELEELRKEGTGDDTELVIITPYLADLFTRWSEGKTKINKITGFPEYGFFDEVVRAIGAIGGAVVGGPAGAAVGRTIAGRATGQSWGNAATAGLKTGAMAMGANALAGAAGFGGAIPGLGGGASGLWGGGMYNPVGGLMSSFGIGGGGMGGGKGIMPLTSVGQMLPGGGGSTGGAGAGGAMGGAGNLGGLMGMGNGGGGGGILSSLGGNILPLAASGFMAMKGAKDDAKNMAAYEQKIKSEQNAARNRHGYDMPWKPVKPLVRTLNPTPPSPDDIQKGKEHNWFINEPGANPSKIEYLADGGPVRGRGNGQSDQIPRDIKNNSYIIDASTVSDIGNGSTDAGFNELNDFFAKLSPVRDKKAKGGYIKALLSDGEYEVSPEKVSSLGGGSNSEGAKLLENLVKQMRSKKRTSGQKLPPKTNGAGGFFSNIRA